MNKMRLYIIIGILLIVLNTLATASTDWAPPESRYLEKIQIADLIVVGNISHIVSKYSGGGKGNIITTADLEVHEILKQGNKSSFKAGNIIPIYTEGGKVGNSSSFSLTGLRLTPGPGTSDEGIIFLILNERYEKGMYKFFNDRSPTTIEKELITEIVQGNLTVDQQIDLIKKNLEMRKII